MARKATQEPQPKDAPAEPQGEDLVDIEGALALLKTTRPTFYRWLKSGKLKGMKVGRQWRFYKKDIERFLKGEDPLIETNLDLAPLTQELLKQFDAKEARALGQAQPSVNEAVNLIIQLAIRQRASDIHLAAMIQENEPKPLAVLRYRIDGALQPVATFDLRVLRPIVDRWKVLASCDLQIRNLPQDGRITLTHEKVDFDLRVNFTPALFGEAVTVRVLSRAQVKLELQKLSYSADNLRQIKAALDLPWGIVIATGPTAAGLTTTLYSCLNAVARPNVKAVSIENPVEYAMPGVVQVQVHMGHGITFAAGLRSLYRGDPDVVMIGEVRDRETAHLAMEGALTGHLILTALHTENAASAITRLLQLTGEPFLVGESVKLIVAQRLVRKLCADCSRLAAPHAHLLERARDFARRGGCGDSLRGGFREAVGCPACGKTGYYGRMLIAETLRVTPEISAAIQRGDSAESLQSLAISQGMRTFVAEGVVRAAEGLTTLEEVLRFAPSDA